MPGTARLRAIEAALNIPHSLLFVNWFPMMSKRENLDEKPRKRQPPAAQKRGAADSPIPHRPFRDWQIRVSDSWS